MNLEQQLDPYIHEHMQRKLIPGLSLAVIILTNQDSKPWDMAKEVAGLVDPAFGA